MPQPGVSDDIRQSTANVCSPFSGQMTTFHPVPAYHLLLLVPTYPLWTGCFRLFFEPSSQSRAAHAKDTHNSAHTCTLVIICNNLFLLFFGVTRSQLQNRPFTTIFAPILLMTLSIMTIFDDVNAVTKTAFVDDCFLYHAAKFITSL